MFAPFTDRARKVMAAADRESRRHSHKYVGTGDILLSLVKESGSVGAGVLKNLGVNARKLRLEVNKLVESGPLDTATGKFGQDLHAEKIVEYALAEARTLNHDYVGTQHLLLGLLRESSGTAAQALVNLGLRLEDIRKEVLHILGQEQPQGDELTATETVGTNTVEDAMFERFTDRARKVMALANQEAQRLNHEYIGTEHILLGLVKEGSGTGATVLKNLGMDIEGLRSEVEKLVKSGPDMVIMGKLPQTPRAKRVVEYAIEEARAFNHRYIGTEHILLGLLREKEGIAAQVLTNLGLNLDEVRREVCDTLGGKPAQRPDHHKLPVWQMANDLAHAVYKATSVFPKKDGYGVAAELRRTAMQIPPNIAEAYTRRSSAETRWLLNIALTLSQDVQYGLEFAARLGYLKPKKQRTLIEVATKADRALREFYALMVET